MEHNIYPCAFQRCHQLLLPPRQSHQAMKLFQSQILPNSYLPLPIYPSFLILELPQTPFSLSTLTQTLMTLASSASSSDIVNDVNGSGCSIESVITVAVDETTLEF